MTRPEYRHQSTLPIPDLEPIERPIDKNFLTMMSMRPGNPSMTSLKSSKTFGQKPGSKQNLSKTYSRSNTISHQPSQGLSNSSRSMQMYDPSRLIAVIDNIERPPPTNDSREL